MEVVIYHCTQEGEGRVMEVLMQVVTTAPWCPCCVVFGFFPTSFALQSCMSTNSDCPVLQGGDGQCLQPAPSTGH